MMKHFKRITAAVLVAVTALATTACGGKKGPTVDATKTQLNVGVFNAGLGTTYFDEMAKDFEAYYAETSFETGKKGVEIVPLKKKDEFTPNMLLNRMKNYEAVLYFLDQGDYDVFCNAGLLADVTDVMTDRILDEDGELAEKTGKTATQSVEDTMLEGYSDYYKKDGKYYAVPFWNTVPGIIYDADLFNERRFYSKKDGSIGANQADIDAGNCSTGPDGKLGTTDDGLPNTWNDFVTLMARMVSNNVTPFAWDIEHGYQISRTYNQIWANYEGYDDFILNYTLNGTDSTLGEINEDNYVKLVEQEGRKAAIKAFYDISKNDKNYSNKSKPGGGNTHTGAQQEYIDSINTDNRIAMFIENSYWEQESREFFNKAAQRDPDQGYGKRNFKLMAIPRFIGTEGIADQTNTERVIATTGAGNYICISAQNKVQNSELQTRIAKLFIKFVQQRSQLVKFTANSGCIRPFNYTMTEEEEEACTPYTRSILTYIAEGAKVATNLPISLKRRQRTGESGFNEGNNGFGFRASVNGVIKYEPFSYFFTYKDKTVEDCYAEVKSQFNKHFTF